MAQSFDRQVRRLCKIARAQTCRNLQLAVALFCKPGVTVRDGQKHARKSETWIALQRFVELFDRRTSASRKRKDIPCRQMAPRVLRVEVDRELRQSETFG